METGRKALINKEFKGPRVPGFKKIQNAQNSVSVDGRIFCCHFYEFPFSLEPLNPSSLQKNKKGGFEHNLCFFREQREESEAPEKSVPGKI